MPETMQKSMVHAEVHGPLSKEQISYFVSDSNGCRCTVEKGDMEDICGNISFTLTPR